MNHPLPCEIEIDSQAKITALSEAPVKSADHDLKTGRVFISERFLELALPKVILLSASIQE
jgi:hypothetical protein